MNCEECRQLIPAFLEGTLSDIEKDQVEMHLSGCAQCREVLEETKELLDQLGRVPEEAPSKESRFRFIQALEAEKRKAGANQRFLFPMKAVLRYAAALALLILGYFAGRMPWHENQEDQKLAVLTQEVKNMKQLVMVNMLKNESASDRIQAVSYSENLNEPSDQIIETLVHTLDFDESPNVRMAAAKALEKFGSEERVKAALVDAFQYQNNPLVQVTLIDIMVDLHETRAKEKLNQMMHDQRIDPTVRKQAEIGSMLLL